MKRSLALFLLTFVSTIAFAQGDQDVFCNSGLRPDGFIDLSALPTAPKFPGVPGSVSAPITVTLPVTGVPGLTVQVAIPPLGGEAGPVYSVQNGVLVLGGSAQRHLAARYSLSHSTIR